MRYENLILALALAGASTAWGAGDPSAGRVKSETCLGCHGITGYYNAYPSYRVPKLSGQNAEYIVAALQAYKAGQRKHETMQAQAVSMSDQDMQDIAAYWATAGE